MTNETQALLSAIETLCGKKKARLLRRLAKAAVKAERGSEEQLVSNPLYGHIGSLDSGTVVYNPGDTTTVIASPITIGDPPNPYVAGVTLT